MPELPEVETVVRSLRPRLVGKRLAVVVLHRTDIVSPPGTILSSLLAGRRVVDLTRRAKRIVFTLDNHSRFYIHLGMTGQLTVELADSPLKKHTHLEINIGGKKTLRFRDPRRFGGIFWLGTDPDPHANIGPEPLEMSAKDLAARLKKTTRPIKNALMDQSVVAGLGNIYVDESLFKAAIHPLTPACKLSPARVQTLCTAIQHVLTNAIAAKGSTLRDYVDGNGKLGTAQSLHQVYARHKKPCTTCKRPIQRIVLGGRSTHFCSRCQRK